MTVSPERQCPHCDGGVLLPDTDGDSACLNCGWAGYPTFAGLRMTPPEHRPGRKGPDLDFTRPRRDLAGSEITL